MASLRPRNPNTGLVIPPSQNSETVGTAEVAGEPVNPVFNSSTISMDRFLAVENELRRQSQSRQNAKSSDAVGAAFRSISMFNGHDAKGCARGTTLKEFIRSIEGVVNTSRISPEDTIFYAIARLSGEAHKFWSKNSAIIKTWDDFKKVFTENYLTKSTLTQTVTQWNNFRQTKSQSILAFNTEFRNFIELMPALPEEYLIAQYLSKINPHSSEMLKINEANLDNLPTVMRQAERNQEMQSGSASLERIATVSDNRAMVANSFNNNNHKNGKNSKFSRQNNNNSSHFRGQKRKREPYCHVCKNKEHWTSDCSKVVALSRENKAHRVIIEKEKLFTVDSGCTMHMVNNKNYVHKAAKLNQKVKIADGKRLQVEGIGSL